MNVDNPIDDIIIIGANPAGLLLAAQLLRFGIHPVIIDRKSSSSKISPSVLLQPRTFEIFNQLGLAKDLLHVGLECEGLTIQLEDQVVSYASYAQWESEFSSLLVIEQRRIEEVLINYLAMKACPIYWSSELSDFTQDSNSVKIRLNRNGQSINQNFKWLVIAEKDQFDIKKNLTISYSHWHTNHFAYQLVLKTEELHNRNQHVFLKKDSFALATPINYSGGYDFIGLLPKTNSREADYHSIKQHLDKAIGFSIPVKSDEWHTSNELNSYLANECYKQRCILIGDAVLSQSGFVGNKINNGMQDAFNIGWKLANICLGKQEDSILTSYQEERKIIANMLYKRDEWLFRLFKGLSLLPYKTRIYLIKKTLKNKDWYDVESSYRKSSLSVHHSRRKGIKAGDKLPFIKIYDEKKEEETNLFKWCTRPGFTLLILGNLNNNSLFILAQWMKQKYTRYMHLFYLPYSAKNQAIFDAFELENDQNRMILIRPDMYITYMHDIINTGLIDTYMIEVMKWKY